MFKAPQKSGAFYTYIIYNFLEIRNHEKNGFQKQNIDKLKKRENT